MKPSNIFNFKEGLDNPELKYLFLCEVINHIDSKNYSREVLNINYRVFHKDCCISVKVHYTKFNVEVVFDIGDFRDHLLDKGFIDFTANMITEYVAEYIDCLLEYEKSTQGALSLHLDNVSDSDYDEVPTASDLFVNDGPNLNDINSVLNFDDR